MKGGDCFIDTNVLLYLLSGDGGKADRAEEILADRSVMSVQILNEFASVATRKLKMTIAEIRDVLSVVRAACTVLPVTEETHDTGLRIADRYGVSVYDAMIVAAALLAGCRILMSEDFQHDQIIEGRLRVVNPFRATHSY